MLSFIAPVVKWNVIWIVPSKVLLMVQFKPSALQWIDMKASSTGIVVIDVYGSVTCSVFAWITL